MQALVNHEKHTYTMGTTSGHCTARRRSVCRAAPRRCAAPPQDDARRAPPQTMRCTTAGPYSSYSLGVTIACIATRDSTAPPIHAACCFALGGM